MAPSSTLPNRRILLLGSGFVAGPCVEYLLRRPENLLTIASRRIEHAKKLAGGHPRATATTCDVSNADHLDDLVKDHDIVISLIPYTHHCKVIASAIKFKKHVVTTSYVSKDMEAYHESAKAAGITVLNEIGVDPGIDHLYALKTINEVHALGGKVTEFESFCGGLPAPECSNNPLGYKFSWSSRGVLLALRNDCKYYRDGKVVATPGPKLMSTARPIFTGYPGYAFVGYPNRDSTPYRERYNMPEAQTVIRGTLRYTGFPEFIEGLVKLGMLEDAEKDILKSTTGGAKPWNEILAHLLSAKSPAECDLVEAILARTGLPSAQDPIAVPFFHGLKWLGLTTSEEAPLASTPLDTLCATLEKKMMYAEDERDMVFLQHKFVCDYPNGKKETRFSTGVWYKENGVTAMARTVGVPCGMGTQLILDGIITRRGVIAPMTDDVNVPLMEALEKDGIFMVEQIV